MIINLCQYLTEAKGLCNECMHGKTSLNRLTFRNGETVMLCDECMKDVLYKMAIELDREVVE